MTNRQRLKLFVLTSALAGGCAFAAAAGELALPPVGTVPPPAAAPARTENATPARTENATPAAERPAHAAVRTERARPARRVAHAPQIHRAPAPTFVAQPAPQPAPIEVASTTPSVGQGCRSCGYLILGVAY